jgi:hypothetical protein
MEDVMRTALAVAIAASIAIPVVGQAQQLSCVKDITYSQAFLAKFPRAGAACNKVIMANGQKWVLFNAEVKGVVSNQLTVDFLDNNQNAVSTMTFSFDPLATLLTKGGEHILASRVDPGEKLQVWMPENRLGFYADPSASAAEHFSLLSESAPAER